jgi:hypothetical protein
MMWGGERSSWGGAKKNPGRKKISAHFAHPAGRVSASGLACESAVDLNANHAPASSVCTSQYNFDQNRTLCNLQHSMTAEAALQVRTSAIAGQVGEHSWSTGQMQAGLVLGFHLCRHPQRQTALLPPRVDLPMAQTQHSGRSLFGSRTLPRGQPHLISKTSRKPSKSWRIRSSDL